MTVRNIFEYLNSRFPVDTACDFDNSGLLVGDTNAKITKVLIALDCTLKTVARAENLGCELIITHHPVIFDPLKSLISGSVPYELVKNSIAVISMHTNLDMGEGGVNDCLCKALELQNITAQTAEDGYILKSGTIEPVSADDFAEHIKTKLGGSIKYVDGKKPIKNVLVCSGSGGEFIHDAINGGFDALVTADIKHHHFLEAADSGISLFDGGHFNTEDIVIEPVKKLLEAKFPEISFITDHSTDIKYR